MKCKCGYDSEKETSPFIQRSNEQSLKDEGLCVHCATNIELEQRRNHKIALSMGRPRL